MVKFDETAISIKWVGGGLPLQKTLEKYPLFKEHLESINPPKLKKDRQSLIIYNQIIAKEVYDIDIKLEPNQAIIPTPGLRYKFLEHNFTHIIENISETSENGQNRGRFSPKIIEVGTGASAIIAILAAKHFDAIVKATEINPLYLEYARQNISRNKLNDRIDIINSEGNFIDNVIDPSFKADLIITNPPYYPSLPEKEGPWGGSKQELIGEGNYGENFIIRFISEGLSYLKKNGVLSFLIPRKLQETLIVIERFLGDHNIPYDITGLEAGNRVRFAFRLYKTII